MRLDHLLSKEHICPQGTDSYRVECWLVGAVVIPLQREVLVLRMRWTGDCYDRLTLVFRFGGAILPNDAPTGPLVPNRSRQPEYWAWW